jgi:hypothetical protein
MSEETSDMQGLPAFAVSVCDAGAGAQQNLGYAVVSVETGGVQWGKAVNRPGGHVGAAG